MGGGDESLALANLSIPVGWLVAAALGGAFVLFLRSKKLPASLALLALGVSVGMVWGSFLQLPSLRFGLSFPAVAAPSLSDLQAALVLLVIPQIPLTLGNAVFATTDTAKAYFGPKAKRVTPKALLTTMGVTNLGAGLLGGMPICHGSGGLTAHFRLGARTGGAGLIIGVCLLAMALFLDGNVLPVLSLIPYPVLAVLVVFVAVQHCLLLRDLGSKREIVVATVIGIVGLATANLAIGVASGMCVQLMLTALSRSPSLWSHPLRVAKGGLKRSSGNIGT
jgi:SulP family sulfate permease